MMFKDNSEFPLRILVYFYVENIDCTYLLALKNLIIFFFMFHYYDDEDDDIDIVELSLHYYLYIQKTNFN